MCFCNFSKNVCIGHNCFIHFYFYLIFFCLFSLRYFSTEVINVTFLNKFLCYFFYGFNLEFRVNYILIAQLVSMLDHEFPCDEATVIH